jgi:hypothetical protein
MDETTTDLFPAPSDGVEITFSSGDRGRAVVDSFDQGEVLAERMRMFFVDALIGDADAQRLRLLEAG